MVRDHVRFRDRAGDTHYRDGVDIARDRILTRELEAPPPAFADALAGAMPCAHERAWHRLRMIVPCGPLVTPISDTLGWTLDIVYVEDGVNL